MRVRAAALVCLFAGSVALVGCGTDPGSAGEPGAASCVGPYLDDQPAGGRFGAPPPTVGPGDSIELHGHWYTSTCNDTGQDDPVEPLPDVRLTATFPGGAVVELGPFTPGGEDLGFTATVDVPEDARSGPVVVSDDRKPPATYRFRVGDPGAALPEVAERDGEGFAPPVTLDLDGRRVDLDPWTACYGNGCADGAPRPPYVDVGDRASVPFSFPDPGWEFTASFRSAEYAQCPRVVTVPVRRTSDHTFEVVPAGPPGRWWVDLSGGGPTGDVSTTFTWTTTVAGALPGPATGSAAVLADHDGELDSYGVELFVQDLAAQPDQASATVTVTSSAGRAVTLTPHLEQGCWSEGSLSFLAPDDEGRRATQLGDGPFTYDVALVLDGTTYHGLGTWPAGETGEIAPHVPLTWTPALPAYEG